MWRPLLLDPKQALNIEVLLYWSVFGPVLWAQITHKQSKNNRQDMPTDSDSYILQIRKVNGNIYLRMWPPDATLTILLGAEAFNRSNNKFVSKKCPRWLVPNCTTKPSSVLTSDDHKTPVQIKYGTLSVVKELPNCPQSPVDSESNFQPEGRGFGLRTSHLWHPEARRRKTEILLKRYHGV